MKKCTTEKESYFAQEIGLAQRQIERSIEIIQQVGEAVNNEYKLESSLLQKSDKGANGPRDQCMICRLADNSYAFFKCRRRLYQSEQIEMVEINSKEIKMKEQSILCSVFGKKQRSMNVLVV